jgi:hypothetical protein
MKNETDSSSPFPKIQNPRNAAAGHGDAAAAEGSVEVGALIGGWRAEIKGGFR